NRAQEIVCVSILGIKPKSALQAMFCLAEGLLFERDSRQLDGKALVPRRQALARFQGFAGFLPALEVRHGNAIIEVEVRSCSGSLLQQFLQILPAFLLKEFPGGRRAGNLRICLQKAEGCQKEQEAAQQACCAARASWPAL